jgi:hypothetical protein
VVLNVIANFSAVIQVDIADFRNVETGCDDDVKTLSERKEKEDGLNGDVADDQLDFTFKRHFSIKNTNIQMK